MRPLEPPGLHLLVVTWASGSLRPGPEPGHAGPARTAISGEVTSTPEHAGFLLYRGFLREAKNSPVTVGRFLYNWPHLHKFPPGISPFRGQRFQRFQRPPKRSQGLYRLKSRLPGQGQARPSCCPPGQVRSMVLGEPRTALAPRGSRWMPRGPASRLARWSCSPSR